jgi:type VI secretion system VasD/TssJ family lipoprotein
VAATCACAVLSGCAATKALHVSLTATADCNSCGKSTGYPLTYRVLQVTDASVVTGMSLAQLWNKESNLLGPALLDRQEFFVDPGQTKSLPVARKPGAAAIIVVGNFCRPRGTCWFYAQPLSAGGSVKLVAGPDCLKTAK